jgi:hypothetical protein
MAEGPNVADGSEEGMSRNWLFQDDYCDAHAKAQSVAFQDVQKVTVTDNERAGEANKAFALGQGSTGAVVRNNKIGSGYGREVGFDDPSAPEGHRGAPARQSAAGSGRSPSVDGPAAGFGAVTDFLRVWFDRSAQWRSGGPTEGAIRRIRTSCRRGEATGVLRLAGSAVGRSYGL